MRKSLVLSISVLLSIFTYQGINAQIPSDTASLPFVVTEIVNLIEESIEQPVQTNEYVQMVFDFQGFPTGLTLGQSIDSQQRQAIRQWVVSNPSYIEKLLIARKKNYDLYFNPAVSPSTP